MYDAMALQHIIALIALLVAAVTDIRKGLIYNWLTLPAIVVGLLLSTWQGGWSGLGVSFLGILVGGGVLFMPFCFGVMGGGDVKLMAAIGALLGVEFVSETLLASILIGGLTGFGLMIVRGKLKPTLKWYMGCLKAFWRTMMYKGIVFILPKSPEVGTAPFGVSILVGAVFAYYFDLLSYVLP